MKKIIKRILLCLAVIIFVLAVVEVSLRLLGFSHNMLYMVYDKHCYWRLGPNQKIRFINEQGKKQIQTINSFGARGKEFKVDLTDAKKRLLCLGDSFTYGWEVADSETFPAYLENMLNSSSSKWQVLNFGCNGHTILHELNFLKHYGLAYKPDVVLIGASLTDFDDITELDNSLRYMLKPGYNQLKALAYKTAMGNIVLNYRNAFRGRALIRNRRKRIKELDEQISFNFIDQAYASQLKKPSLDIYFEKLEELVKLSAKHNFKIIFVFMPVRSSKPHELDISWASSSPKTKYHLGQFFDEINDRFNKQVIVVELMSKFTTDELFLKDGHLNPQGNKLAAEIIYENMGI